LFTTHLETSEPCIGILIPVRFVPQLLALLTALGCTSRPTRDTTAEPAPSGLAKVQPLAPKLRRVG